MPRDGIEERYVDRHYLDDYVHYYARSFSPPETHCSRLHFSSMACGDLRRVFGDVFIGRTERQEAERLLASGYLGFVVRRPLASARIGRTVLKTYPLEGRRHYEVVRPYRINILGLGVALDGLAYQQQDRGAAVCASTALWSALQRVASVAGHRTPTPSAITRAARSPFPASHGLDHLQMADALSALGYIADVFTGGAQELFKAKLWLALRSQLPVVLILEQRELLGGRELVTERHAVTVTGFSEPVDVVPIPMPVPGEEPIPMRGGSIEVLYVHDDNLGSHAHYELTTSLDTGEVVLRRGRTGTAVPWWRVDDWIISLALVPKPEKLRQPIENLLLNTIYVRPMLEQVLLPELDVHYAARFSTGVEYRLELLETTLRGEGLRDFQFALALPRFIGVVTCYVADVQVCDVILDASEIDREPSVPPLLALVGTGIPSNSEAAVHLAEIGRVAGVPVVTLGVVSP